MGFEGREASGSWRPMRQRRAAITPSNTAE
jgi:hypothetical protein